jgi:hypothetical protein
LIQNLAFSDINSTSGNLNFDANSQGHPEMVLNAIGLGIGTTPTSANLEVQGNALISRSLAVGSSSQSHSSNLHLSGSMGYSMQNINSSGNLEHSMALVDTSVNDITLTLSNAATLAGRIHHIKKKASTGNLILKSTSSIDDKKVWVFSSNTSGALPFAKLISDGSQWRILNQIGGVAVTGSENLVAWWTFDETSGNTLTDDSPNNNHGTLYGGLSFTSNSTVGQLGGALSFDGSDDLIKVPHSASLDIQNGSFSIVCWFKSLSNKAPRHTILSKKTDTGAADTIQEYGTFILGTDNPYGISTDQALGISWGNGGANAGYDSSTAGDFLAANGWKHSAITYDSSATSLKFYVDGTLRNTYNTSGNTFVDNNAILVIGNHYNAAGALDGSNGLHGALDDLRIYNRVLSSTEINLIKSGY